MRTGTPDFRGRTSDRSGVALIVVLGMLTVITILAVSFAIAMRFEQFTAKRYSDQVRARHFLDVGVVWAMEGVNQAMDGQPGGFPYPYYWDDSAPASFGHAYASRGDGPDVDLFTGSVTGMIPVSLWSDVANTQPGWAYVVGKDPETGTLTATNGRVAFLVVNVSGLIDANTCTGGTNDVDRFAPGVVDFDALEEVVDPAAFLDDRDAHRRYETLGELTSLNAGIAGPSSNLFVYSYDPDPHRYMVSTNGLGRRDIALTNKFAINAITNYDGNHADAAFSNDYFRPLTDLLAAACVTNPVAIAWNVIAFLDEDRRPETGTATPWREDYGGEATPLINEIVLSRLPDAPGRTNHYAIDVEAWYPFVPRTSGEGYTLRVAVFSNWVSGVAMAEIMERANPAWSFEEALPEMRADDDSAFVVVSSPSERAISFPVDVTLPAIDGGAPTSVRRFLPIGIAHYQTHPTLDTTVDVTVTNRVWVLARILNPDGAIVDESLGYDPGAAEGDDGALLELRSEVALAADDPRVNSHSNCWLAAANTLGTTNASCSAYASALHQGLPIYHHDGAVSNIVDIGQVVLSEAGPWRTIDLLDADRGQAILLDRLTASAVDTNAPWQRGLVNPNSRHPAVLRAMLGPPRIEQPVTQGTNAFDIEPTAFDAVIVEMTNAFYASFADMFADEYLAATLRACAPSNDVATTDYQREFLLRPLVNKASFRENLLAIIVAAESLSPDGAAVLARRRAFVLVCRDAYTGAWFVKQRLDLAD